MDPMELSMATGETGLLDVSSENKTQEHDVFVGASQGDETDWYFSSVFTTRTNNSVVDIDGDRFYDPTDALHVMEYYNDLEPLHLSLDWVAIKAQHIKQQHDMYLDDWTDARMIRANVDSKDASSSLIQEMDDDALYGRTERHVLNAMKSNHEPSEAMLLKLRPHLGFATVDRIRKTLDNTTQMAKAMNILPMVRHYAARFKMFRHRRLQETVATDTIFSNIQDIDGKACAQIFFGTRSRYLNVYGMNSKKHYPTALKDFMRDEGIPSVVHSDNAKEQTSSQVEDIYRRYLVKNTSTEPDHPWQNPAETQIISKAKSFARALLDQTGAPAYLWLLAMEYFAYVHNRLSNDQLGGKTPYFYRHGETPDISALLSFQFYQQVYYLDAGEKFPSTREKAGYWVGVAEHVGDHLTYWILTDDHQYVLARSVVRPADVVVNNRLPFREPKLLFPGQHPSLSLDSLHEVPCMRIHPKKNVRTHPAHPIRAPPHTSVLFQEDPLPQSTDSLPHATEETSSLMTPGDVTPTTGEVNVATEPFGPPVPILHPPGENDDMDFLSAPDLTFPVDTAASTHDVAASGGGRAITKTPMEMNESGNPARVPIAATRYGRKVYAPDRLKMAILGLSVMSRFVNALSLETCDPTTTMKGKLLKTPIEVEQDMGNTNMLSDDERAKLREIQLLDAMNGDIDQEWLIKQVHACQTSTQARRLPRSDPNKGIQYTSKKHVRVLVEFYDGNRTWVSMDSARLQDPTPLVAFAVAKGLINNDHWKWCKEYLSIGRELNDMRRLYAARTYGAPKYKFGVQVPENPGHATVLDERNKDTLWKEATDKEIGQINDLQTFKLPPDDFDWTGYRRVPYHIIYDCKFDLRRKARLVLNGNLTPDVNKDDKFSGVIGTEAVRLGFLAAEIYGLDCCVADVATAFLHGITREKLYIIAGPEFGPKLAGKRLVVYKSCYGLKTSAARFHEHLAAKIRKLGFKPSRADNDLWMRPTSDGSYDFLATYVDDLAVWSKDPMPIIEALQQDYTLRGIGKPEYYLGGNIEHLHEDSLWTKHGVKMAMSAETYIQNTLERMQRLLDTGDFKKADTPMIADYHPEQESSPLLDPLTASKYRAIIGCLNWIITLGRMDIHYATNTLARYSQAPRVGHFAAARRVLGYLRQFPQGRIILDPRPFDFSHMDSKVMEFDTWKEYYPDAIEEIPDSIPKPTQKKAQITCFVDADHAHDTVTRRSVTGIILFVNQTPVKWISKRQATVETSTYGSELVAARQAMEAIIEMRYNLRMLGFQVDEASWLFGDNMSVVLNTTMPSSMLKKKHHACSYHRCREVIAASIAKFIHVESHRNIADVMTKPLPRVTHHTLMDKVIFRKDPLIQVL